MHEYIHPYEHSVALHLNQPAIMCLLKDVTSIDLFFDVKRHQGLVVQLGTCLTVVQHPVRRCGLEFQLVHIFLFQLLFPFFFSSFSLFFSLFFFLTLYEHFLIINSYSTFISIIPTLSHFLTGICLLATCMHTHMHLHVIEHMPTSIQCTSYIPKLIRE